MQLLRHLCRPVACRITIKRYARLYIIINYYYYYYYKYFIYNICRGSLEEQQSSFCFQATSSFYFQYLCHETYKAEEFIQPVLAQLSKHTGKGSGKQTAAILFLCLQMWQYCFWEKDVIRFVSYLFCINELQCDRTI